MQLSWNDCRNLSSALETLYGIMSVDHFPFGVLSVINRIFPCDAICYNEVSLPDMNTSWFMEPASAMPSPGEKEIFARHMAEHPLFDYYTRTGDGRSLRISDLLSQRQFRDSGLYSEFYMPIGVEYQLGTIVSIGQRQIIGLALDRNCSDFSENERSILDILRPHLSLAYKNVQAMDLMKRAEEARGNRLLLVDHSGQVHLASDDVWKLLSEYFDVRDLHDCLPELLKSWISAQRYYFCDESDAPSPSVHLVIRKLNGKLMIRFIWGGKAAEYDLILMEEDPAKLYTSWNNFGLTRREMEILAWLSQDKTNAEIALALSVSPRTVKKHLEHIYSKLQVHKRSGAVARSFQLQ